MQVLTRSTHHYLQVINLRKSHPPKPVELPIVAATAVSAPAASVPSHLVHWPMHGYNRIVCSLPELCTPFVNDNMHLHLFSPLNRKSSNAPLLYRLDTESQILKRAAALPPRLQRPLYSDEGCSNVMRAPLAACA
jgi:hypothetical protein